MRPLGALLTCCGHVQSCMSCRKRRHHVNAATAHLLLNMQDLTLWRDALDLVLGHRSQQCSLASAIAAHKAVAPPKGQRQVGILQGTSRLLCMTALQDPLGKAAAQPELHQHDCSAARKAG